MLFKVGEDNIIINIKEWKDLQVENNALKKNKELLNIENLKLEKLHKDIIEDLKYYSN